MVLIVKTLWLRRRIVAPGLAIAALLAVAVTFHVKAGLLPRLQSRETRASVASSQILIDSPVSAIGDMAQGLGAPEVRATVYANLMTTTSLINSIAAAAGVPANQITVAGPLSTDGSSAGAKGYHLTVGADVSLPIITVNAQAPTKPAAIKLANGVTAGLSSYVGLLAADQGVPAARRVVIRQLGAPILSTASFGTTPLEGVLIFIVLTVGWCMLVLFGLRAKATWRAVSVEALLEPQPSPAPKQLPRPARALTSRSTSTACLPVAESGTNEADGRDEDGAADGDGTLRFPRVRRRTSTY
jgi:hypothetical protein